MGVSLSLGHRWEAGAGHAFPILHGAGEEGRSRDVGSTEAGDSVLVSPRSGGHPSKLVTSGYLSPWEERGALPTQRNGPKSARIGWVFWRGGFCTPPTGLPRPCCPHTGLPPPIQHPHLGHAPCRMLSPTGVPSPQDDYHKLLTKYAEAENTIDQLRLGARVGGGSGCLGGSPICSPLPEVICCVFLPRAPSSSSSRGAEVERSQLKGGGLRAPQSPQQPGDHRAPLAWRGPLRARAMAEPDCPRNGGARL